MPTEKTTRRQLIRRGLALGALGLVGDAFGIEPSELQVVRVDVPIRGLGLAFDGYRIALFSDLHWPACVGREHVHRVVKLANAFDPDLVAVPGDHLHGRGVDLSVIPDLRGLFDGLRARDGVVSTLGNHDVPFGSEKLKRVLADQTPFEDVENRHRVIARGNDRLAVGGVEDIHFGIPDPVRAFAGLSPDVARILLSHSPDVAEIRKWPTRIDLQLSGHTHGGEVRLPFLPAPFTGSAYGQKFLSGLNRGASHRVYTTRGVGSPRGVRLFCRPEVTWITLRSVEPQA